MNALVAELAGLALREHKLTWVKHHAQGADETHPEGCAAYDYVRNGTNLDYQVVDGSKCNCGATRHNQRVMEIARKIDEKL